MNQCTLIGRLTKDSEMRTTISGQHVVNFTLAINRNYKNEEGEYETDFINCIAFNKTAELITKYTQKGSKIALNGRIQVNSYDAQDGTKKYATNIVAKEVYFLDGKKESLDNLTDSQVVQKAMNDDPFADFELTEQDLPF